MVAPPYVFAAIVAMCVSISSDRRSERYSHLVITLAFGMVGYIIAAATTGLAPRYFSLFLMLAGVYGGFNVSIAWTSSTLPRPIEKRATALALTNMVGNFAQIYSPYLYQKKSGPRYIPAMTANTVFVFAAICLATILRFCLMRENRKLDAIDAANDEEDVVDEKGQKEEIVQQSIGGLLVLNPGFRYVL
ncbi:hypothetical protein CDV55_103883 [Aspergillus turcosus]|uniref:Major facilitator superfamily (MFS) profile domain-containing protein n=1 Tax=Aspergillus turcosus TaxID=1245748 RepID=A0A397GT67_9EURO|nr:hypothetical protein CDV55_103883 [Aspergillus turcosus]RLL94695.1 hypothetical protein CFD26_104213 [Aspergillus turcosus]